VSVCVSSIAARQRLCKCIPPFDPVATNARYNRTIVGRVSFYAVCAVSKESNFLLCIIDSTSVISLYNLRMNGDNHNSDEVCCKWAYSNAAPKTFCKESRPSTSVLLLTAVLRQTGLALNSRKGIFSLSSLLFGSRTVLGK
jgi:hypothetical protein